MNRNNQADDKTKSKNKVVDLNSFSDDDSSIELVVA
jgi:hypothetical protein